MFHPTSRGVDSGTRDTDFLRFVLGHLGPVCQLVQDGWFEPWFMTWDPPSSSVRCMTLVQSWGSDPFAIKVVAVN